MTRPRSQTMCRSWSWSWSEHFGLVSNSDIGYVVNVTALNMAGIWLQLCFFIADIELVSRGGFSHHPGLAQRRPRRRNDLPYLLLLNNSSWAGPLFSHEELSTVRVCGR